MKKAKLAASLIAVSMAATTLLTGCDKTGDNSKDSTPNNSSSSESGNNTSEPVEEGPKLEYKDGTELRMGCGYNNAQTGIAFDTKIAGSGVTLVNGKTYQVGDLKPTWEELQNRLNIKFKDVYQGKKDTEEFEYWSAQFDQVDILSGSASQLTQYGAEGSIIDLSQYLSSMPNFRKYLEDNPIVRLSIIGSTTGSSKGAIYFSPYFDGVNDIERMPLMRTDWVEKLLNGEGDFAADKSGKTATPSYTPYMPTSGKVEVDIVKADGSGTEKISKDYDKAGNIIKLMNDKGSMTGVEAVNMLRKYIDEAYNGHYGTNRADLFIGQDAAWDADEMVALLRCVVANANTLNGTDAVIGLYSREDGNMSRKVDLFRFAGTLFGVRGLESRQDYLYIGTDNELHDARMEEATYDALEKMNQMTKEGLISQNFIDNVADTKASEYQENNRGFMSYDYNQTQTLLNDTVLKAIEGAEYRAVMVPVARWYDGSKADGVYMRFTESWRSVKTGGWGISAAGVKDNPDKLNAALALIDYAYSDKGIVLMSYGPDEFIKTKADGSFETFDFNGEQRPVIADKTAEELWTLGKGNYTNYARQYLGSTLSFLKLQSFEYQCTTEIGKKGAGYISKAIALGTIKHPLLEISSNAWYTSVPTVLPLTKTENDEINSYTMLGSKGKFGTSGQEENVLVTIIAKGYSGEGTNSKAATIASVTDTWGGSNVLELRNTAWKSLYNFYQKG